MDLSREDVERIARTVVDHESRRRNVGEVFGEPRVHSARSPGVHLVEVTSSAAVSDRYPGRVVLYDAVAGTWTNKSDVWVITPSGIPLAVGKYLARRTGEANGRPVYIVAGTITLREKDLDPSVSISTLEVDQDTGVEVYVDSGIYGIRGRAASTTQMGMITTGQQNLAGSKTLDGTFYASAFRTGPTITAPYGGNVYYAGGSEGVPLTLTIETQAITTAAYTRLISDPDNSRLILRGGTTPNFEGQAYPVFAVEPHAALNPVDGHVGTAVYGGPYQAILGGLVTNLLASPNAESSGGHLSWPNFFFRISDIADQPSAGSIGFRVLHFAQDHNGGTLYLNTGSSWLQVARGVAEAIDAATLDGLDSTDFANAVHGGQHEPGGSDALDFAGAINLSGDTASRPAASAANNGLFYFDTDTDTLYRSNGTAWTAVAPPGGGTIDADTLDGLDSTDFANAVHGGQHEPGGSDALDWTAINLVGTLASRPAASAANNGLLYFATDDDGGTFYRSNGSTWVQVGPGVTEQAADAATLDGLDSTDFANAVHSGQHEPGGSDALDFAGAINLVGTLASRPAASAANNGLLYFATDDDGGTFYRSNGSTWVQVGPGVTEQAADAATLDGLDSTDFANAVHSGQHEPGGSDAIDWTGSINMTGTLAARPAAASGNAGALYFATDTNLLYRSNGSTWTEIAASSSYSHDYLPARAGIAEGRLTTESGVAVSSSDRTAQTTLYYTPYNGNHIALWNGSAWEVVEFTEKSLSMGGLVLGNNYDVFGSLSSGALVLSKANAWVNDTTRQNAVSLKDGVWVLDSDHTKRLLGTVRATGSGATSDALATRFVSNLENLVPRRVYEEDTTSHSYGIVSWRAWNAGGPDPAFVISDPLGQTVRVGVFGRVIASVAGSAGFIGAKIDAFNGADLLISNATTVDLRYGHSEPIDVSTGEHTAYGTELGNANAPTFSICEVSVEILN